MGIISRELETTQENFWQGIMIYCRQPNSINKEVLYSEGIFSFKIKMHLNDREYNFLYETIYNDLFVERKDTADIISDIEKEIYIDLIDEDDIFQEMNGTYCLVRKLLPKKASYCDKEFYEILIITTQRNSVALFSLFDKRNKKSNFDPLIITKFNKIYACFNDCLFVQYSDDIGEKGINWIKSVFVNKLVKMMLYKKSNIVNGLNFSNLINILNYYKLYERLKSKYAKNLIENWSENTDPQKFVFEDIGIASYLLLLWNNGELPDGNFKVQRFVDLGCGNGLLVYILNSEGHKGVGFDIRKRKIWDTYPSFVFLKEEAVIPGVSVYPDADWLIGNHSDELTPWLPVMARRSSAQCQYFVLPCCAFQFNGQIYQRKNSGLSVYHDHIRHVKIISEICEFATYVDRLRIPSTKRICIVGKTVQVSEEKLQMILHNVNSFIQMESQNGIEFKLREAIQPVRNCTRLPKEIINGIVRRIAEKLLSLVNNINFRGRNWNQGGSLPLSNLVDILSPEQLKYLKNECKGLQTLIKNHHYVFRVFEGIVRFRNIEEMMEMSRRVFNDRNKLKWKNRECWFHENHPDGCPLAEKDCSYKHK